MRAALSSGDGASLRFTAHALKGSAAALGAYDLSAAAVALEVIAENGRLDEAPEAIDRVVTEVDRVGEAIGQLRFRDAA